MPTLTIGDLICCLIDLNFSYEEISSMTTEEMYITVYNIVNSVAA